MCGWMHLPRYIDKIRLQLAGKLHADYQNNLGKGFDGKWLELSGVKHEEFVELVGNSMTDGEIADWVSKNVSAPESAKDALREHMLNYPRSDDTEMIERLALRKK